MEDLKIKRDMAQLAILQRIELANKFLMKVRKLFGRYLFSKIFSKFLINKKQVSKQYLELINKEYKNIEKFLIDGQRILTIGGGIGGIELLILKKFPNTKIDLIEKNYISKKITYGWDDENQEGYNNLLLTENFLILNESKGIVWKIFVFKNFFKMSYK